MGSFDRSARACNCISGRNHLDTATFDFLDAPVDFGGPSLLDIVIFENAGDETFGELHAFRGGELQRLRFYSLELGWHCDLTNSIQGSYDTCTGFRRPRIRIMKE